ncbi:MAG: alpha/beta hydrolase-fold protein, partial [bacterium]
MRRTLTAILLLAAAAAALPAITDTIDIREWIVGGPFPSAPREGIVPVIDDAATFRPSLGDTYYSGLVQGGVTLARKVTVDSLGWLATDWQGVRWDTLQDYYGNVGLYCAGFAYAEFSSPHAGRAVAVATELGGFTLNGRGYTGDVYGAGWFACPVELDSGLNRVLLRLASFGDDRVRFRLVPPPADVRTVCADATKPDLVADSALDAWLGLPVQNLTGDMLSNVVVTVRLLPDSIVGRGSVSLPPWAARKLPVRIKVPRQPWDSTRTSLPLLVETRLGDSVAFGETLKLDIRRADEVRRITFLSAIDSSVQFYAVLYPRDFDPVRRYPVIYTLHGAGVDAAGQARAYKPKDWAFVVAPTNRRHYGFDWQDWGRLDAMEVLDTILARLPIDPDRVSLVGGSMGGHGTWHVGLTHPDRFAVASPQAGWPTHQLYVPWFLQRSSIFAQPGALAMRERVLRSDNTPAMLGNARNLPYFILHGGDDDNVPPLHARNFKMWADELGLDVTLHEVPGRGHWYVYEDLGITCVDDTALMSFIRDKRRDPGPRHVRFRTADLGTAHSSYWVAIDRVAVVGQDAVMEAWADDSLVRVQTANVDQFALKLDGSPFFAGKIRIEIDGARVGGLFALPGRLTFHRKAGKWQPGPNWPKGLAKTPAQYGPARQALMKPFLLVYGTRDTALARDLRHAATQEALRWWLIANGDAPVLDDTAVNDSLLQRRNVVLYGGPDQNTIAQRIAGDLPCRVRAGRLEFSGRDLGDSAAAVFVRPSPFNPDRLVLVRMGTGAAECRLAASWGFVYSGAGMPDFVVFDKRYRRWG